MKVELTEDEILTITEALKAAPSAHNYDCGYLSAFRKLLDRFKPMAYNTRFERGRRRRAARAIRVIRVKTVS